MPHLSTIVLTVALLATPLAVVAEHAAFKTWHQRLAIPELEPEPARHTPRFTDGTILPPVITRDLDLTAGDNPILLPFATLIPPHITVTFGPGTALYTREFAHMAVAGRLNLNGTASQPVILDINELHPQNQVWSGLTITDGGQATLTHTRLRHATPALTCLPGSRLAVSSADIAATSLGVFTESVTCHISSSRIRSLRDGLVAIGAEPHLLNTKITAGRLPVRYLRQPFLKANVRTL